MNPDGGSRAAVKVKCPFDATGFGKDCRVQQSGTMCSDFAVIQCVLPRGFQPAFKAALVPPKRWPLQEMKQISCLESAVDLQGDPGSTFLFLCPSKCNEEGGILEGSGI